MAEAQAVPMGTSEEAQRSMRLPLRRGDQNGNAFSSSCSSSSSRSSSSSCSFMGGEHTPDSMRSVSSLSSGRTDSPLDIDMPEGEMGKEMPAEDIDGKAVILNPNVNQRSDYPEANDNDNDNDRSVSVYLDAEEDSWNDNLTLVITLQGCDQGSVLGDNHGNHDNRRQSFDNSAATEAPMCSSENGDDEGEEDGEEDSFLSLSSGDMLMRSNSVSLTDSERTPSSNPALAESVRSETDLPASASPEICQARSERIQMQSSSRETTVDPGDVLGKGAVELPVEGGPTGERRSSSTPEMKLSEAKVCSESGDGCGDSQMLTPDQGFSSTPLRIPPVIDSPSHCDSENLSRPTKPKAKEQPGSTYTRSPSKPSSPMPSKPDIKRFPRLDLRNVKAKIVSRSASTPRPANMTKGKARPSQSPPGNEKIPRSPVARLTNRGMEKQDGVNRKRSSSSQARAVAVLRPSAGRGSSEPKPKAAQQGERKKMALGNSVRPHRRSEVITNGYQEDQNPQNPTAESHDEVLSSKGEEPHSLPRGDNHTEEPTSEEHNNIIQTVSSKLRPSGGTTSGARTPRPAAPPAPAPAAAAKPRTPSRDPQAGGNLSPPRGRPSQPAGLPKMRVTERPVGVSSACPAPSSSCKPAQNVPPPRTVAVSKLPIKGLPTSPSSSSQGSAASESNPGTPASKGPVVMTKVEEKASRPGPPSQSKPSAGKTPTGRMRTSSIPGRSTATGLKTPGPASHAPAKTTQNLLQRSGSARFNRPTAATLVDRTKTKTAAGSGGAGRAQPSQAGGGQQDGGMAAEEERLENDKKNHCILQLRKLITNGNRRLEALALVIQHIFGECEEALKQKKELSQQLANLRDELGHSVTCCERLEKEKEEVHVTFEEALQKLQEQHQEELGQLEERLREFYAAEWDKTHQAYQEEADKYRALMQQQVEEMKTKQEALRREQEEKHGQQMEALKQQHESSLTELRLTQVQDLQDLDQKLHGCEASLGEKIQQLTAENETLNEKLRAEDERRRELAEKSLKDSHTLYLEQELESLKVVLEIKTNQLHQQERKLMQMDKLAESNVKLEESLNKLQQENEDYKARMDKHAALSKQLSTEQVMLQQNLQKESKVNKRLSMENEELLWKLHNSDLNSPRRLSPTSPFNSPRNSASFSSAPLSPR